MKIDIKEINENSKKIQEFNEHSKKIQEINENSKKITKKPTKILIKETPVDCLICD